MHAVVGIRASNACPVFTQNETGKRLNDGWFRRVEFQCFHVSVRGGSGAFTSRVPRSWCIVGDGSAACRPLDPASS